MLFLTHSILRITDNFFLLITHSLMESSRANASNLSNAYVLSHVLSLPFSHNKKMDVLLWDSKWQRSSIQNILNSFYQQTLIKRTYIDENHKTFGRDCEIDGWHLQNQSGILRKVGEKKVINLMSRNRRACWDLVAFEVMSPVWLSTVLDQ